MPSESAVPYADLTASMMYRPAQDWASLAQNFLAGYYGEGAFGMRAAKQSVDALILTASWLALEKPLSERTTRQKWSSRFLLLRLRGFFG